jgi:hypothetical protein
LYCYNRIPESGQFVKNVVFFLQSEGLKVQGQGTNIWKYLLLGGGGQGPFYLSLY